MLKLEDKRRNKDRQLSTRKHTAWQWLGETHSLCQLSYFLRKKVCHVTPDHCLQVWEALSQRDNNM